jgi:L-lactate dehydrogenase complex protein LldG
MSKQKILNSIRQNKPQELPLPDIDLSEFGVAVDNRELFIKTLTAIGGKVHEVKDLSEITFLLCKDFPNAKKIISKVAGIDVTTVDTTSISRATELNDLDLAIINGQFGVAENGAVWVSDKDFDHRSIPFITAHLGIVLDADQIVQNLHQAYQRIENFKEGYGVFISGPSKTADIEQSLVIGAQGPLSLTVFLMSRV